MVKHCSYYNHDYSCHNYDDGYFESLESTAPIWLYRNATMRAFTRFGADLAGAFFAFDQSHGTIPFGHKIMPIVIHGEIFGDIYFRSCSAVVIKLPGSVIGTGQKRITAMRKS
jgi:hypothetical protein